MAEPEVLVFDVNETLLDFAASLEPIFQRIFGDKAAGKRQAWFGMAVHSAFTATITKT
jgi:FMN phosphatase YigB (HAD superfamily)